jgi:HSP20 family protein
LVSGTWLRSGDQAVARHALRSIFLGVPERHCQRSSGGCASRTLADEERLLERKGVAVMSRSLTTWGTRFPRSFFEMENEFPKLMERMFGEGFTDGGTKFQPEANISETDQAVEVSVELPGLKPDEIKLEMHEGQLWITGEKKEEKEEKGKTWHRVERRYGSFRRVLPIPATVDESKVDACFHDGVLKVTLPKTEAAQPKAIPIKGA